MSALAEYCIHAGATVEGSDVEERFYTDAILESLAVPIHAPFSVTNLPAKIDLLFYSAAYDPRSHPELVEAARRGVPCHSYPEALGLISAGIPTAAVAGVHGKTTTTGLAGSAAAAIGLPVAVIVGSAVANFNNRSCLFLGDRGLIVETCEYRRNFLNIHPRWLIVTSIEPDHLDYYTDYADIFNAFLEYASSLPPEGSLIYCADDAGAVELAAEIRRTRTDLRVIPYGFAAEGPYRIEPLSEQTGSLEVKLAGHDEPFELRIPGSHNARNAAAAAALVEIMGRELDSPGEPARIRAGLAEFRGSKRRSEIIGEARGILFMDDYAHHPTAIKTTLAGLRRFYPKRRIVVDFMSHTYSRTAALLEDFACAFEEADLVILHEIYASAREAAGTVSGELLYQRTAACHPNVHYLAKVEGAATKIDRLLAPGDLFLTMGAGNNWVLSHELYAAYAAKRTKDT